MSRLPRSVREADVAGKTVLVLADLNVPLESGAVADDALRDREVVIERVALVEHPGRGGRDSGGVNDRAREASDFSSLGLLPRPRGVVGAGH